MFCPKCGHKNEEEARFCEECGVLLAKAEPERPRCPRCGAGIADESAGFCPECGKPLREEEAAAPVFEEKAEEEKVSMKLPIVLGVIAAVLAAAVIGLGIWYSSLSKKADDYTVPDFSQLMEETEDGNSIGGSES